MSHIWTAHVHNACFDVQRQLQDIRQTFRDIVGDNLVLFDKYCLLDRQLALMDSEAKRLIEYVNRTNPPAASAEPTEPKP